MIKTFFIYFAAILGILTGTFALLTAGAFVFVYIADNLSDQGVLNLAMVLSVIVPAAVMAFTLTLTEHNDEDL